MDTFFDILETEDPDAVSLFRYWLNDYFRQMTRDVVGVEIPEFRGGEDDTMLAENFRIWRDKVFEEGIEKGKVASTKTFALKLISRGLSIEDVAAIAELGVPVLQKLLQ